MGLLIDNAIYTGATGAAGEMGDLPIGSRSGGSGPTKLGPFEVAVGATAFTRHAHEAIAAGDGGGIAANAGGEVTATAVLDAARSGDAPATAVVDGIVAHLTNGLTCVAALFNPQLIVLGGEIGTSLFDYVPRIHQSLAEAVPDPPHVQITSLGDRAIATGAVRRGIDYVEAQLFDQLNTRS